MQPLLILEATFKLGIPVLVMSWLLFSWLYREGKLEIKAGRKATAGNIKEMKKEAKDKNTQGRNYIYDKWMWFGSGFYGLAALWTLFVMEMTDIFHFIFNLTSFSSLLTGGLISILLKALMNQIANIVSAFVWFQYWSSGTQASPIVWFGVAYLGYLAGIELAKRFNIKLFR